MSNIFKILISSLIIIFISILFYLFIFSNIFYVKQIDFININLENRYKKELISISSKIEDLITVIENSEINDFVNNLNSNKFIDKQKSKTLNLADELSRSKKLIIESQFGLEKIKIFDNNKKILFSTDDNEIKKGAEFISFASKDNIENKDDFFEFNKNKNNNYIFDNNNNYIIIKRNIPDSQSPVGLVLFYYKNTLLNDLLRKSPYIDFNKLVFINNNLIIIEKPKDLEFNKIINIDITKNKQGMAIYTDSSGNEISKSYRIFFYELKNSNLYICRFISNDIFKVKKSDQIIIFYFLLFTLYLLILLLFLLRKSTFEKAREKMSLFVAAILEEMIEAKTKGDVEKIHRHLELQKENVLKNVFFDFKRLKEKDKKSLQSELDNIFNRISEGLKQKEIITSEPSNINKIEQIFEKFISTIAEKGININAPIKVAQKTEQIKSQSIKQEEKPEDIEDIEEIEEINEIQDAEQVEEISETENVEEIKEADEVQDIEDVEEISEAADVDEIKEIDEDNDQEIKKSNAIQDVDQIEEINEAENIQEIEQAEEIIETESVEEINEINETEVDQEINETEEIQKTDNKEDLSEKLNDEIPVEIENENISESKELSDIDNQIKAPDEIREELDELELSNTEDLQILDSDVSELTDIEELPENTEEAIDTSKRNLQNLEKIEETDDITEKIYADEQISNNYKPLDKKRDKKEYKIDEIFDKKTNNNIDELLNKEIVKAEIPDDINIDSFFNIDDDKIKELNDKNTNEEIEELKSEEEIPKIPDHFYTDYKKNDKLAETIKELSLQKTPIQIILEDINNRLKPYKITLLMNVQKKYNFMQIHQLGFEHARIEKIILDENNLLTKHLFTNKRMIYVADINKVKNSFNNEAFEKELNNMKSLLLYPIKIFGKIRSILVLIFNNDESENLEYIIETIENKQNELRKNVIKLI